MIPLPNIDSETRYGQPEQGLTPSPPLSSRNFRNRTMAFHREAKNVQSGIMVTIMDRATARTNPVSYSKLTYAFRPRSASAARANLGTVPFIALDILATAQSRFVSKHASEGRPASIKNGFSHSCLCQRAGIYVTNDNRAVGFCKTRRLIVKEILTRIFYFCMNSPRTVFASGALGNRQFIFIFSEIRGIFYNLTIGKCGEAFKTKIDAYRSTDICFHTFHIATYVYVPSSAVIAAKGTADNFSINLSAFPVLIANALIDNAASLEPHTSVYKRNPPKRLSAPITRAFFALVARFNELATYGRNGIAVQPQLCSASGGKFYKIECGWSRLSPLSGLFLCINKKVPYKITSSCMTQEFLRVRIFYAVFVGDKLGVSHARLTLVLVRGCEALERFATPFLFHKSAEKSIVAAPQGQPKEPT